MMRKSLNSVASWQSGGGGERGKKGLGCYRAAAAAVGSEDNSVVVKGAS